MKRARELGWGLFWASLFVALLRAATVGQAGPPGRLADDARQSVGRAAAVEELKWRKSSVRNFPDDHWSQDDDFSASERQWVVDEANRRGVPAMDVFRAIDEDLHAHRPTPPRKSNASPCKPRPYYD